jgi:ATP-dependent Clp protease ATP-binding subunit ClpX
LKLLEGSSVEVPVGATSKNAMVPLYTMNTSNILFICGGAFPELEKIIARRLNETGTMGFGSELKDHYKDDPALLNKTTVEDLREFGMIPEFLGRLPIICPLQQLTEDMLVQVLTEPKNAILKQYQKLLRMDEVDLVFNDDALHMIAKKASEKKIGARALRAIIEEYMLDIMYQIPKDDMIGRVTITGEYISGTGAPLIELRSSRLLGEHAGACGA